MVYSSILPQKQWVGGAHALFRLNRATSLIYIQALAEGILTPHGRVRVGVIENPGNNQLGDNAAAAIASLIHALPKLKSLLLAGNILGSLASGQVTQVAVDQVSMDHGFLELPWGIEEITHVIQIVACTYWILLDPLW